MARVFDEQSQKFVNAPIKQVFQTGVKPTFRITLENGRSIECTKEHRFLTDGGFVPIEDALGLQLIGKIAVISKPETRLACNGIPTYQNKEWLAGAKLRSIQAGSGLLGIAEEAGITIHTVRKWLKKHGLQFTKKEVASYRRIWNRGKRYKGKKHAPETIEKMRKSARKGSASNLWRGGVQRSERLAIADWCSRYRTDFLRQANYKCNRCGSNLKLELHHIQTVAERPDLAREK